MNYICALVISGNIFDNIVNSVFTSLIIMAVVSIGGIYLLKLMNNSPLALTAFVIIIVAVGYYLFGSELIEMVKGY